MASAEISPKQIQEDACTLVKIPLWRYDRVVAYTLVDKQDEAFVNQWKWRPLVGKKTTYAMRSEYIPGTASGSRAFYLHRELLGLKQGAGHSVEADHINFDGLDNRRCNLRVVTRNEQNQHRRASHKSKSGVAGVTFIKGRPGSDGYWQAQIYRNGAYIHRSSHRSMGEAIRARNEALALYESKREQVSA